MQEIDNWAQALSFSVLYFIDWSIKWTLTESTGVRHQDGNIGKKERQKYTQKFLEKYLGPLHPGSPSQKPTTATNKRKCLSNDTTECVQDILSS